MIAFQHVSIARTAHRPLWVEDVSFEVETGEIFGIAGPEGSGKSALLRAVNGLVRPVQGDILVDGQSVCGMNSKQITALRRKIGWLPESPALIDGLTLEENIALPLAASGAKNEEMKARIRELLAVTGLEGLGGALPGAVTFAQQKRASLARALALKPRVLLCMEPVQGLGTADAEEYLNLLDRLNKELELTLFLSTRDLHVIKRLCNRAAILKDGKVVEQGDAYTLLSMSKNPFTLEYLAQQLSFELPEEVREHATGTIVLIEYMGDPANEPVLYETAQRYGVEFNILQGHIEYIGGKPLGRMYVSFNAEPALMVSVLAYLKSHTYRAEVIQDV